jgi:hypothetical protein
MIRRKIGGIGFMAAALTLSWITAGSAREDEQKPFRLEGEYTILLGGRSIGVEKYVVISDGNAISSASTLEFRNPNEGPKKVSLETKLEMDDQFQPRNYELKSEVDGKKGSIQGEFAPNQVIFSYAGGGASFRNGLLVGDHYTILDTNAFHHFIFLTRLFKYGSSEKSQQFEVVIPQEKETGTLKISEIGKEDLQVKGKKLSTTRLKIDTGVLTIQVWVDGDHVPRKIAVPEKGIEVISGN